MKLKLMLDKKVLMYCDTRNDYRNEFMNDLMETEMYKVREKALEKLSSLFVHHQSFSIKDWALTLAYGFFESHEPSERIAYSLDLGKIEFLAIMEEFSAFKLEIMHEFETFNHENLKNYEEAQNF